MKPFDLNSILSSKPDFEDDRGGPARFWMLNDFDGGNTWIGQWSGESPWERHAKGDEFLHVLKGQVEVTVITKAGPETVTVPEGNIFVVPRNLWHKQKANREVIIVGATPGKTDHSETEPTFDT